MSNPDMSTVERYLMSDEARENVRVHLAPTACSTSKEGWVKDERGPWRRFWLSCTRDDRNKDGLNVYFRPEGDRYIVTDLGEGVRALRMRTGMLEPTIKIPHLLQPDDRQFAEPVVYNRCTADELPDSICKVMLSTYRVANLEIK